MKAVFSTLIPSPPLTAAFRVEQLWSRAQGSARKAESEGLMRSVNIHHQAADMGQGRSKGDQVDMGSMEKRS